MIKHSHNNSTKYRGIGRTLIAFVIREYLGVSAMIGAVGLLLVGASIWLPIVAYLSGEGFIRSAVLAIVFWPGLIWLLLMKIKARS